MNAKVAKKLRKLHQRDVHKTILKQTNYLRTAIKPCPANGILFRLWKLGARFYFTQNHIEEVQKSYDRLQKQSASAE